MESTSYTGYGIVYRALCVPSGKSYVGQTVRTLEQRWRAHKESQSACHALKSAIRKYGAKAFVLSILDTANDQSDLNAKEEHWIATLGTVSPGGYNIIALDKGRKRLSPETREKMRQAKLKVAHTPEFLEARSQAGQKNKGKKKSPEHIAAASKAQLATRARNGFKRVCIKPRADKGKPRSDEVKAAIRAGQLAYLARKKAASNLTGDQ